MPRPKAKPGDACHDGFELISAPLLDDASVSVTIELATDTFAAKQLTPFILFPSPPAQFGAHFVVSSDVPGKSSLKRTPVTVTGAPESGPPPPLGTVIGPNDREAIDALPKLLVAVTVTVIVWVSSPTTVG